MNLDYEPHQRPNFRDASACARLTRATSVTRTDFNPARLVITQLKPITVIFSLPEDKLPQVQKQLRQGEKLTVEAYDRENKKKLTTGMLLTLDNQIDVASASVKARAIFTNDDDSLFPNQFVNARLLVETERDVTLVPTRAIQRNGQGNFVYAIQPDQTVKIKTVTLGVEDANTEMTAVEGIEPGETVASDNFNRLVDGAKVVDRQSIEKNKPAGRGAKPQAGA